MSKLLNSGQTGISHEGMAQIRRNVARKWEELKFLNGLSEGKINIAELLEGEPSMILTNPFNLTYHTKRFQQQLEAGDIGGMEYHLRNIIRLITKKIIKDHCE